MERKEIFEKLDIIFEDVLDLESAPNLTEGTTSSDIEEWDSLSQIQLIVAIEKSFGLKFTAKEIIMWANVGEMVDSIEAKMK